MLLMRREHFANDRTPDMNAATLHTGFELRFQSLFDEGRALAFPCDAAGHVDLDALSARARHNYFFARSLIGRDFAMPAVRRSLH
jgi:hypothetical protein